MSYHFTAAECRKILACHYGKSWHNVRIAEELEEKFESNATADDIGAFIDACEYFIYEAANGRKGYVEGDSA